MLELKRWLIDYFLLARLPEGVAYGFVFVWILRWLFMIFVWQITKRLSEGPFSFKMFIPSSQTSKEIFLALMSNAIVAIPIFLFRVFGTDAGSFMPIYNDVAEYGISYLIFTGILLILTLDLYFYFTHRLLHLPWFYKYVHGIHHKSQHVQASTGISFHPVEAFILYSFPTPLLLVLPLQHDLLNVFTWFVIFHVTRIHAEIEFPLFKSPTHFHTSEHHHLHHSHSEGNYGLIFHWWDRFFKTEIRGMNGNHK